MPSTRPHIPRLAFVFDFDKTLAGDSFDSVLGEIGMDRRTFDTEFDEALGDGWDPILRRGQALIDAVRSTGRALTRDLLDAGARANSLYPGVTGMPARLQAAADDVHEGIEVGFHILSAGFEEMIRPTAIASHAGKVVAGAFHFDGDEAVAVRRTITHPEKALYLRSLAEGKDYRETNAPGASFEDVAEHDMHVLYDQMVFVGDGLSDLQAFGFLEARGGVAIAIDGDAHFDHADAQSDDQRVENLAPPDYSEGAELMESLIAAARAGAARIGLRARGRGE